MTQFRPFADHSGLILIDGKFQQSASTQHADVIDPASATTIGTIAETTDAEVDDTIAAATLAQRVWWGLSAVERTHALHSIADSIHSQRALLAEALTREMGKPYKEAFDEIEWTGTAFRYYAELSRHDCGRVVGPVLAGQLNLVTKHPLGVVGIIMPFNYPYCLFGWQAAAALGAGNGIVLKPSEQTSLSSLLLLRTMVDHLPPGLIGCVTGGAKVGAALVAHNGVGGVAFTGSIPAGKAVAGICASTFKKALIETSGNDPFIVMPSAPIDVAARAAVFSSNLNAGQVCAAAERFYVHEAVYDQFVERVVDLTRKIRIGNGLEKVDMGPLVSERERTRYEGLLSRAIADGATLATGGGRPDDTNRGFFVDATVLVDVDPDAEILNTETFGPVTPICRVASFDQAITLANRSQYALGSVVYTTDLKEVTRAMNELEAGMTWINAPLLDNDAAPFGGRKLSGSGSQLGSEGLEQFRHSKMVMIDPDCAPQDFWWFPYADAEMFKG